MLVAIMGGVGFFAAQVGRRQVGLNSLAFVAALMALYGGGAPLNPPEWIARWRPQVVLLSVAAGDAQGRPDPQVLQSVEGRTLLRTDQNGWVRLSTDWERLWVEVERP
jgi:hypothetical protein